MSSFSKLGLCKWICDSVSAMGYKNPTNIQTGCIPPILSGKDVFGFSATGSGKTATFALPILQDLSRDPYGIFCLVLTPSRELAMQISEQFTAFGATFGVRVCLVIGGISIIQQRQELDKLPHVVIATPGRIRHHIDSATPPRLSKCRYFVLDEADRLMADGFRGDIERILSVLPSKRSTLLFSATLTEAVKELEAVVIPSDRLSRVEVVEIHNSLATQRDAESSLSTMTSAYSGGDTNNAPLVPSSIHQLYLFVPTQVRMQYLIAIVTYVLNPAKAKELSGKKKKKLSSSESFIDPSRKKRKAEETDINSECVLKFRNQSAVSLNDINGHVKEILEKDYQQLFTVENANSSGSKLGSSVAAEGSIIVFVNTCKRCEEVTQILNECGFPAVALHSVMSQVDRMNAIGKFKSCYSRILVATDIASRGLDIQNVELVINYDLPREPVDYVHRVGRTGRAGKQGTSLSVICPSDITTLHNIEDYIHAKLELPNELSSWNLQKLATDEAAIVPYLPSVSRAMRVVQLKLMENGFEDKIELHQKRKKSQNKSIIREKIQKMK